ncbi:hypothetical protein Tco_0660138 [Tanacetum coccineum]
MVNNQAYDSVNSMNTCNLDSNINVIPEMPVPISGNPNLSHKPNENKSPNKVSVGEVKEPVMFKVNGDSSDIAEGVGSVVQDHIEANSSVIGLFMPLEGIHVDDKLQFMEEPVEIMEREIKRLKRSRVPLVKVRWNSRRGPEFTWEHEDSFKQKYPQLFTNRASSSTIRS